MSLPRRFRTHWGTAPGSLSAFHAFAGPLSPVALGTTAAALTHFSAIVWTFMSSVVVIVRPPASSWSQFGASGPQTLSASSWRTAQTKCGAFHGGVFWGATISGSPFAAISWAGLYWAPERTVRPLARRSRIVLRRW